MLSQYGTWMRQLAEVRRMEESRVELRSELGKVEKELSKHENVSIAFRPEELKQIKVAEYQKAYLASKAEIHRLEEHEKTLEQSLDDVNQAIISFNQELRDHDGPGGSNRATECTVELLSLGRHDMAKWDDKRYNTLRIAARGMAAEVIPSTGTLEMEVGVEAEGDM